MRRIGMLCARVLLLAVVVAAPQGAAFAQPAPTSENRVLITLAGDSITEGVFTDSTVFVPPGVPPRDRVCWEGLCFADVVRDTLASLAESGVTRPADVRNRGIGGATSRDWDPSDFNEEDVHFIFNPYLQGLFYNIHASDIVVHYVGTNDAVAFFEAGDPTTEEHFEQLVLDFARTLRRRGTDHVLLVTPPIPAAWSDKPQGDRMRGYGRAVRRACRKLNRRTPNRPCLIDLQAVYPEDGWEGGAIHPTQAGHLFIAQVYLDELVPLLKPHRRGPRRWYRQPSRW